MTTSFAKQFLPIKEFDLTWQLFFKQEIKKPYFKKMYSNIKKEYEYCKKNNIKIFPNIENVFAIFKLCPLNKIKVVILGQDPYIKECLVKSHDGDIINIPQACGLAFSVSSGINPPPSLKNIYKELINDSNIDFIMPKTGNLKNWTQNQGVFLLNSALTVRAGKSNSHKNLWIEFTDNVINHINNNTTNIVFLLWGKYAQSKSTFIDSNKHCIIQTSHPSPMSAKNGFLNSNCFSDCNNYLSKNNILIVNWNDI